MPARLRLTALPGMLLEQPIFGDADKPPKQAAAAGCCARANTQPRIERQTTAASRRGQPRRPQQGSPPHPTQPSAVFLHSRGPSPPAHFLACSPWRRSRSGSRTHRAGSGISRPATAACDARREGARTGSDRTGHVAAVEHDRPVAAAYGPQHGSPSTGSTRDRGRAAGPERGSADGVRTLRRPARGERRLRIGLETHLRVRVRTHSRVRRIGSIIGSETPSRARTSSVPG